MRLHSTFIVLCAEFGYCGSCSLPFQVWNVTSFDPAGSAGASPFPVTNITCYVPHIAPTREEPHNPISIADCGELSSEFMTRNSENYILDWPIGALT